jgi:hypothetical protein
MTSLIAWAKCEGHSYTLKTESLIVVLNSPLRSTFELCHSHLHSNICVVISNRYSIFLKSWAQHSYFVTANTYLVSDNAICIGNRCYHLRFFTCNNNDKLIIRLDFIINIIFYVIYNWVITFILRSGAFSLMFDELLACSSLDWVSSYELQASSALSVELRVTS